MSDGMFHTLYIIAIIAEAMSAALVGGRRGLDWLGVCVIAWATALGGGSLRDVLLGRHPLSWVQHPEYLLIVFAAALCAGIFARWVVRLRTVFLLVDALGLVVFTVLGCEVAMGLDLHWSTVLLSGMITGTFGGVVRDVLCAQVPLLFQQELYASVALLTGGLYLSALELNASDDYAMTMAIAVGFGLRLIAIRYKWKMPKFVEQQDWD